MHRMRVVIVVFLFSSAIIAQSGNLVEAEPLIVTNVKSRLVSSGLFRYVTLIGVNRLGNRVLAVPKEGVNLHYILQNHPEFGKDMFNSSIGHKGCLKSFRQKKNPSLQVVFYEHRLGEVTLEIDIDRYAPWWNRPFDIFQHVTREVGKHWVQRKLFRRNPKTSQRAIAKALAKEAFEQSKTGL